MATNSLGLPKINITFTSLANTAIIRSSRGVVAEILNDSHFTDEDGVVYFNVKEAADIRAGIDDKNVTLIKKVLEGAPQQVHVFCIPNATYETEQEVVTSETVETTTTIESDVLISSEVTITSEVTVTDPDSGETSTVESDVTIESDVTVTSEVEVETTTIVTGTTMSTVTVTATVTSADVFKQLGNMKVNYICHPTGGRQAQEDLATWVKQQRANKAKTFKAVVGDYAADSRSVINLTTGKIRVNNPAYLDALDAADGDEALVDSSIDKYVTYTAAEYTSRLAGIFAGIALDRSATYYSLSEVVDCEIYDDIEAAIDRGELCLFNEHDGNGVKIARAINSLHTFTASEPESFRYIKIVEGADLIVDDISTTFKENYIGQVVNTYANKMLFIASIDSYFRQLGGTVLDLSVDDSNYVELDLDAHRNFAQTKGIDVSDYNETRLERLNTGTHVYLRGKLTLVNTTEDLYLEFTL